MYKTPVAEGSGMFEMVAANRAQATDSGDVRSRESTKWDYPVIPMNL